MKGMAPIIIKKPKYRHCENRTKLQLVDISYVGPTYQHLYMLPNSVEVHLSRCFKYEVLISYELKVEGVDHVLSQNLTLCTPPRFIAKGHLKLSKCLHHKTGSFMDECQWFGSLIPTKGTDKYMPPMSWLLIHATLSSLHHL